MNKNGVETSKTFQKIKKYTGIVLLIYLSGVRVPEGAREEALTF